MITWMQKHKKYLVVTIWISTIAFVGAGFVGWGAYSMNTEKSTSIAKVGHRAISVQEFKNKYGELYSYYNQLLDGKLTEEKAKEMGIENLAIESLVQENLLLNFADDLGLGVNDDDIVKYIVADQNFQIDGKFSKDLYNDVLKRARINPADYEKNLKRAVLLDKLRHAINLPTNKNDIDMMTSSFLMQDRVSLQVVKAAENEITIDEDGVKKLWEESKGNYKTKTEYNLETSFIPAISADVNVTELKEFYNENKNSYKNNEDKIQEFETVKNDVLKDYNFKISKKIALEEYLLVKKGEKKLSDKQKILEDDFSFPIIDELKSLKAGDMIKPFEFSKENQDGYMIAKLVEVKKPEIMSYKQAREQVLSVYKDRKEKELVEQKAKKLLNDGFKGKDIGFISRDSDLNIEDLSSTEFNAFVSNLFDSNNKQGYVLLDNKAVVYEILEQKLLNNKKENEYKDIVTQNVSYLKNSELIKDLTSALQKRYQVEYYYKR
ncbi:peptidylprolyl isomerase [Campylobacter sp. RM16192]|uniref:peptidylprolyl isomerase n=1 Tax=Campylobacter sp. RM16192 TaxID=1660080 RepID=UPI0014526FA1|nr:peptidylprolyl isomerase [Campylobacter sp. RM16192]QCD52392.1 putative periplasmic folding chaperone [Campylobacter sp. RM16192]